MAASALLAAPVAAFSLPSAAPSLEAVGSLTALGVFGTGISFVLYYDLIAKVGPAKASLVACIAPGFAVIYGVVLLDESFTLATAAGLLLIVGGSWLAAEARLPWQPKGARVGAPATAAAEAAR
jgi:drug/metabolite transporter (DMT)-like permease